MNYEALKHIYTEILISQNKTQYHENDKYTITQYFLSGEKYWKQEYKNGQQHGKYTEWDKSGSVRMIQEYKDGQKHGKYIWRYENGSVCWDVDYKNGKPHGKLVGWNEYGRIKRKEYWDNGILVKKIV